MRHGSKRRRSPRYNQNLVSNISISSPILSPNKRKENPSDGFYLSLCILCLPPAENKAVAYLALHVCICICVYIDIHMHADALAKWVIFGHSWGHIGHSWCSYMFLCWYWPLKLGLSDSDLDLRSGSEFKFKDLDSARKLGLKLKLQDWGSRLKIRTPSLHLQYWTLTRRLKPESRLAVGLKH